MSPESRPYASLTFRIGILIVLTEIVVLAVTGWVYISRFSLQVDERLADRVQTPGTLMASGMLDYVAVSNPTMLSQLVGDEVVEAMVVSQGGLVVSSMDSAHLGRDVHAIEGFDASWFDPELVQSRWQETSVDGNAYLASITPVRSGVGTTLHLVYIRASARVAEHEKTAISRLFLLGTLACVLLTTVCILISFQLLISGRVDQLLSTVREVETGDLSARVSPIPINDEIGTLQLGVNDMISRISERTEEREHLQEQLQQAQKMEAVGTLAGGIAHDFNNLLTGVLANVDLALLDIEPDTPAAECLHGAVASAERAADLTRQLLALSRKQVTEKKPTRLSDVLTGLVEFLERSLPPT